jgi:hypothetical protein
MEVVLWGLLDAAMGIGCLSWSYMGGKMSVVVLEAVAGRWKCCRELGPPRNSTHATRRKVVLDARPLWVQHQRIRTGTMATSRRNEKPLIVAAE